MADASSLRTNYVNPLLGNRIDGSTRPWTNTQIDGFTASVFHELWPDVGLLVMGDMDTDELAQEYDVPAAIERIVRIDILDPSTGYYVDQVSSWRPIPMPPFTEGGET